MPRFLLPALLALALAPPAAYPRDAAPPHAATAAQVRVVFTPEHDGAGEIIAAIGAARRQVLVQAYAFTHAGIADALIAAHRRGVEVKVIGDRKQHQNMPYSKLAVLARSGVPVWLDGKHQGAHNKVMVIDADHRDGTVITGSFNFTRAAQHKNAENIVFISNHRALAAEYADNWQRHLRHARILAP